ncbi:hypothetical protein XA68_12375 [Ophiocordyceps unilateralis]|uniref:RING-type E3 ubiquitin transferase n=1 Tax=Ophiocordyceps unilateralis TaxID=268505 RepID=A0A2A9PP91_OPHUN|nr:hypothetical protein XA68_12375 [Ophiocordyceps unilateralis]
MTYASPESRESCPTLLFVLDIGSDCPLEPADFSATHLPFFFSTCIRALPRRLGSASSSHLFPTLPPSTSPSLAFRAIRAAGLAIGLGLTALNVYQRRQEQMASPSRRGGRLDATSDRAVVYCHACSNEWYRDEHGLYCPACGSDITEIVDLSSDPRPPQNIPSPPSPASRPVHYDDDSDPDVADIDEFTGPHGFIHRRSVRTGHDEAEHHDPGVEPVIHRFYEMIQNFSPARTAPGRGYPERGEDGPPVWPRVQRTTFTSGPYGGGTASVTIFSGPPPPRQQHMDHAPDGLHPDPFQAVLSHVLRDLSTPPQGDQPPQFARSLQEILSLFSPANAAAGDAVYSQEALDRIITQLMETNPQSNAAPPASEEALRTLERKTVDRDMLKGESKTECTICIEDMTIGDQAVVLPCKHWFHEECVVLWLKEHNTCPICRTPIEAAGANNSSNHGGGDNATRTTTPRTTSGTNPTGMGPGPSRGVRRYWGTSGRSGPSGTDGSGGHAARFVGLYRPVRLEPWPSPPYSAQERNERERGGETPLQPVYNSAQRQGRTSTSPESPNMTVSGVCDTQIPQRIPSQSSRDEQGGDGGSGRPTSQGPISWLRERFAGGGSHPGAASRGERRYQ